MAKLQKISTILISLFLLFFALTNPVSAQSGDDPGRIVLGGTYTLDEDETLQGDLIIIGGTATLKAGSEVKGDIMVAGGTINANGVINGNILSFGGLVNIKSEAIVRGDLVRFGGIFNVDEGADIQGNMVSNEGIIGDFGFFEDNAESYEYDYTPPAFNPVQQVFSAQKAALDVFGDFLWSAAKALGIAVLTVIASLFLIKPMEKTAETLNNHPALSIGVGLLTMVAFPLLMVLMLITIILIPVSIIGIIAFGFVILFGWFALSLLIGRRIAELLKTEWSDPLYAGVGSLALSLVTAISSLVPCVGWLLPVLFAGFGLGAVVMSRFGTRVYLPNSATPTRPAAPQTYTIPAESTESSPEQKSDDVLPQALLDDLSNMDDELPPLDLDDFDDGQQENEG